MPLPTTQIDEFLTDEVRTKIADLADLVIPGSADKPSASEASVHSRYIDRALNARPDLVGKLTTVLSLASAGELDHIPEATLEPVVELLIVCYFMSPKARRSINYAGQSPTPIAEGEAEYYLEEDDLLGKMMQRGPLWRATPDDPTAER